MIYKSPKATVGAVLYQSENDKKTILLTKRNIEPFKNYWCFPGGHVEEFENLETAVVREIKEETNLSFQPDFLHYFEEIFPDKDIHNVALFYTGEAIGDLLKDDKEVLEIKWFSIDEAMKMDLAFSHNKVLEYYKKKFEL